MTLHTFGRDLKWNPHIHCPVCEEAYVTLKDKMKNFSFMSYEKSRKTWMFQVLDLLSKEKLKGFRYLKEKCYKELDDGFYSNKNRNLLEKVYQLYGIKNKKHIRNISERKKELKIKLNHLKFRTHMIESYARDPLLCTCGALMKHEYTYDPFEGDTPNDRQYRERCLNESRRMRMDRQRN